MLSTPFARLIGLEALVAWSCFRYAFLLDIGRIVLVRNIGSLGLFGNLLVVEVVVGIGTSLLVERRKYG